MGEVIRNVVKELRQTTAKLEDAEKTAEHRKKKCEEFKQKYLAIKKKMKYIIVQMFLLTSCVHHRKGILLKQKYI